MLHFADGKKATRACRCSGGPQGCRRGPRCAIEYQGRLSGPLLDRIDLQLDVPPVTAADLALPASGEGSAEVAARVARARDLQGARAEAQGLSAHALNAEMAGDTLEALATPDEAGAALLAKAAAQLSLSARAYHRTLRVARTIADLDGGGGVKRVHVAEALGFRRIWAGAAMAPAESARPEAAHR